MARTVDADGVALAAIQSLYKMLKQRDAEIRELKERIGRLQSVEARLDALERQPSVRRIELTAIGN